MFDTIQLNAATNRVKKPLTFMLARYYSMNYRIILPSYLLIWMFKNLVSDSLDLLDIIGALLNRRYFEPHRPQPRSPVPIIKHMTRSFILMLGAYISIILQKQPFGAGSRQLTNKEATQLKTTFLTDLYVLHLGILAVQVIVTSIHTRSKCVRMCTSWVLRKVGIEKTVFKDEEKVD